VKVGAAVVVAAPVVERNTHASPMEAIKEASNRISNMEKSNADFRSKSAHDRCLVLMRDSGLPDSGCD